RLDFREGGSWLYCMRCVDESQGEFYGQESWGKMVYAQIVRPERIVYTDYFTDAEGNVDTSLPASDTVLEFVDLGGRTRLVSRTTYATPEALKTVLDMGMLPGITQTWDRLEERLAAVA
ncbi:MAG TPA: SRPBCC domain-containing protein, partial [Trueperaceae bacterium]|nr:SRPBCC domain-containing protein [Trueperaceae bacterium]